MAMTHDDFEKRQIASLQSDAIPLQLIIHLLHNRQTIDRSMLLRQQLMMISQAAH